MDLAFFLDSSGSIQEYQFDYMKRFVFEVLSNMDLDSGQHRVGVTTFANDVRVCQKQFALKILINFIPQKYISQ